MTGAKICWDKLLFIVFTNRVYEEKLIWGIWLKLFKFFEEIHIICINGPHTKLMILRDIYNNLVGWELRECEIEGENEQEREIEREWERELNGWTHANYSFSV